MDFLSVELLSANSDFELKLVTKRSVGMGRVPSSSPCVVTLSRKTGAVTPKLPSAVLLFHTLWVSERLGYSPLSTAAAHFTLIETVPPAMSGSVMVVVTQAGGKVWPGVTVETVPS